MNKKNILKTKTIRIKFSQQALHVDHVNYMTYFLIHFYNISLGLKRGNHFTR